MKVIETERLILRQWELSDLNDCYEFAKNPEVGPNAGWEPHTSKDVTLRIIQSFIDEKIVWAIVYKNNGKVVGSIGIHDDEKRGDINTKMLGYALSQDYWGKGLMSEAVKSVMNYAFQEMNLSLLSVYHYPFNNRSKRVIEKCGFKYEGTIRLSSKRYDDTIHDNVCYSITKKEYYAQSE